MQYIYRRLILGGGSFITLLVLLGCAHGKDFKPVEGFPPDRALVYFYYPEKGPVKNQNYSIKLIETELGKLRYGRYFTYLSPPGKYTFYYDGRYGYATLSVELEAGMVYYLRFQPVKLLGGKIRFEMVPEVLAKVELLDCRLYP